ncbi:hypothetical protein Prum_050380 [Phytohabitans rumicis]|uniref:Uncharacterized protein n=1 Tax=Phytohabitans rumicis TaxID=1076125 RepID=A0A6V8LBE1_9ACTN|nr:hypothetical protein Prum_050380 [Phytohabitans rumicis]
MVSPGRHPKKEIADALRRGQTASLTVREIHRGHRWGELVCIPCQASRDGYSTPRDPGTHAKQLDRFIRDHIHPEPADRREAS